ncbi:MAG: lysophospholipid acyltransferase family protein [Pyrinomonadaceae bacterium]
MALLRRRAPRGLSQLKARRGDAPLVIYCNHSSSWDGLLAFHVSQICELDSYGMMEEKHLRKYPFHRRLGAFSVVREDHKAALRSIDYAARLLRDKDRVLWIFPQGETAPNDVRPLKLYSGLARIIERTLVVDAIPIAMRYEFLDGFRPEAFLRVGTVERIVVGNGFQTKALTAAFALRLTQTLDSLRGDITARDFAGYEELITVRRASSATDGRNK